MRQNLHLFVFMILSSMLIAARPASQTVQHRTAPPAPAFESAHDSSLAHRHFDEAYGKLPLIFEANTGQTDQRVKFLARGNRYTLFLTAQEVVLQAGQEADAALRMQMLNTLTDARINGLDDLPGKSNYLLGNDPHQWHTNIRQFSRVRYESVWPGIDVIYYGRHQELEYDFVIAPGADPHRIRLAFTGSGRLSSDAQGNLLLPAGNGMIQIHKPVLYQETGKERHYISGRYLIHRNNEISLRVGRYDKTKPLIIDPVISYASYLGGQGTDTAYAIAIDQSGSAYIAGASAATDFPGGSPMQPLRGGGVEIFLLKLNPAGTSLVYATWLGGDGEDIAYGLTLDAAGNAYLTGRTLSANFPVTDGAMQSTPGGNGDAFAMKIDPAGSAFVYSTLLGGSLADVGYGIAADQAGNAYVTGQTESHDLPANGIQTVANGHTVYKANETGKNWVASDDDLASTQVNDFAFDPTDTGMIYAATKQNVYRSLNGGQTWQPAGNSPTANVPMDTRKLAIAQTSPLSVYALASNGIWKSIDAGSAWTQSGNGIPKTIPFTSFTLTVLNLVADPVTPRTIYAGTNNGVYRSTDGGDNWTSASTGLPSLSSLTVNKLLVDPANPATLYAATNYGVFKSINGGTGWTASSQGLNTNSDLPRAVTMIADPFSPSATFWLLSTDARLFKTSDAGANWTLVNANIGINDQLHTVFATTLVADPLAPGTLYAGNQTDGVIKSIDGGLTWTASNPASYALPVIVLAFDRTNHLLAGTAGGTDGFVAKLAPEGKSLSWLTYLGGNRTDYSSSIAVGNDGSAYVAGATDSANFPVVASLQPAIGGQQDAFVAKLNPTGTDLTYATFLGGSLPDAANSLALTADNGVVITGRTSSDDFPLQNALFSSKGKGQNAFDPLSGTDAFVARLNPAGSSLVFSTFLGGDTGPDLGNSLAIDSGGSIWVTGSTLSDSFPVHNPLQFFNQRQNNFGYDAFIARLSADGSSLLFASWFGGYSNDYGFGIAVDQTGSAYVVGQTLSSDLPVIHSILPFTGLDGFVAKIAPQADLELTLTDQPDPAQAGSELSLLVTLVNHGPDTAFNPVVTITPPPGANQLSITTTQGNCNGTGPIICQSGELPTAARTVIKVNYKANESGPLTSNASVSASTPDPVPDNNQASQDTSLTSLPSVFGTVSQPDGTGLGGVALALTGKTLTDLSSRPDGSYQFAELAVGGNYTVTPRKQGFVFLPASQSASNLTTDHRFDFQAVSCEFTVATPNQTFAATGGEGSITITAPDARCTWNVQSNVSWITITSATSGSGNAVVTWQVAPTISARVGTLTIGDHLIAIRQEVSACQSFASPVPQVLQLPQTSTVDSLLLVTADFNHDGIEDIAWTTSPQSAVLRAATGKSEWAIENVVSIMSGEHFSNLATADLNNDGHADLLMVVNANSLLAFYGDGKGGFSAPQTIIETASLSAITTADFNRDGKTDLLLSGSQALPGKMDRLVSFLPGTDTGFGPTQSASIPTTSNGSFRQLEPGDFDHDGRLDFIGVDYEGYPFFCTGDGNGGFTLQTTALPRAGDRQVDSGDFDGNGQRDLLVVNFDEIQIFRFTNGQFQLASAVAIPTRNARIGVKDADQDGFDDVFITSGNGVAALWGSRSGRLSEPDIYAVGAISGAGSINPRTAGGRLIITDFNHDGRAEALVPVRLSPNSSGGAVALAVAEIRPDRKLIAPRSFNHLTPQTQNKFIRTTLTADINTDGLPDFLLMDSDRSLVFLPGDGRGNLGTPVATDAGDYPDQPVIQDFNLDGKPDVAIISHGQSQITILFGDGTGGFPARVSIPIAVSPAIAGGDFNSDGRPDLLARSTTSGLMLLAGDGQGGFTLLTDGIAAGINNPTFVTDDFTGDLIPDLLVWSYDPSGGCTLRQVPVYLFAGDGHGGFTQRSFLVTSYTPQIIGTGDLNSDGRADLLIRSNCIFDNSPASFLSVGEGFAPLRRVSFNFNNVTVKLYPDLNGDGMADMLIAGENDVQMMAGNGDGSFNDPVVIAPFGGMVSAADFNNDGTTDLVVLQSSRVTILLNQARCPAAMTLTTTSAASYDVNQVSRSAIAAAFGTKLSDQVQTATEVPLPVSLAGTSVIIRDIAGIERPAPLFFVSPQQINYQIPSDTKTGNALVQVKRNGSIVSTGTIMVTDASPGLFTATASGQGLAAALALRVKPDGSQIIEPVAQYDASANRFNPVEIDLSQTEDQVFLVLFGTGIRHLVVPDQVTARIGTETADVLYAGPQGRFIGLDQVNLRIPAALAGRGEVNVVLIIAGQATNSVRISIR